jgi:hypothetical protein
MRRSVDVGCGVGHKSTASSVKLLIITETSGGRGRVCQG